jgi:DNA adenine methylase
MLLSTERNEPWSAPLLRWAGSKRQMLPSLMAHTPARFRRYVEPFAGSACLFFALRPSAAVLADINLDLMQAYVQVRRHPRQVWRQARKWRVNEQTYYRIRRTRTCDLNAIERAARFIYLNRYCFNGVYRTNRAGQFNVPRGVRTGPIPDEAQFYRCSVALRTADLRCGDFEECISDVGEGDFVYLDPPYVSSSRRRYGEYGYDCFALPDVSRLVNVLRNIDRRKAVFLLSYTPSRPLIRECRAWDIHYLAVRRHVAGFADHRGRVREILVSNRRSVTRD